MKDALKRAAAAMGFAQEPAKAEVLDATASAVVVNGAADLAVLSDQLASLETRFTEQNGVMDTLTAALAEKDAKLTEALAALADVHGELSAVHAAKEQAEASALATKLAARNAAVVAALGTDKAEAFMAATGALPDAQFESVMAALAVTSANEANSAAFKDVGVDASANVDALVAESKVTGTGALLAAKYQKTASK